MTVIPFSFKTDVHVLGLPAEVKTIFTLSSMQICICLSISGYNKGTFTPKERLVADLHLSICSFKTSGYIDPLPINPKAPALLTALANLQPLAHTIPACTRGVSMLKSFVTRLEKVISQQSLVKSKDNGCRLRVCLIALAGGI